MEENNNQEIDRATRWVKLKVSEIGYGEIGVNFVVHQGEICKTEYRIVEKRNAHDPASQASPPYAKLRTSASIQNPKPSKDFKLIRVDDVSKMLGVHPVTVRRWVSQGKIPYIKIGSAVRFDPIKLSNYFGDRQR